MKHFRGNVMFSLFLMLALAWPVGAEAAKVHGVFRVVKGDVRVKSAKDNQIRPAKIGQQVFPKDTILTGKDSRAKIVMVDKNEINVSPDSQIVFENYEFAPEEQKKNVLLNVIYGKVRAKVEQKYDDQANKFQIKTQSAVAGVRGTDFITSFNSQTKVSEVVTFQGEVVFGQPGPNGTILNPVSVTPGRLANITPGRPPTPPTPVPADQLANLDQSSDAEFSGQDSRTPATDGADKKSGEDNKSGEPENKEGNGAANDGKSEDNAAKSDEASGDKKAGGESKDSGSKTSGGSGTPGASKGPQPTADASGSGAGPTSDGMAGREPSSVPPAPAPTPEMGAGSGLLRPEDMATAPMAPVAEPVLNTFVPPAPAIPNPNDFNRCDFCRETVESGNATVIIRVTNGNP